MGKLGQIALGTARTNATAGRTVVDIITFIEADWGLKMQLYPVQRVILKTYYGIELDNNPHGYPLDGPVPPTHPKYDPTLLDSEGCYKYRVSVSDWRRQSFKFMTEEQFLAMLHAQGRCNIGKVIPGHERRELVLAVGRRSGKTEMSSCIAAYETYRLLAKGDPQTYYGIPPSENIQLISFATDKDQAGILYQKVSGYFRGCAFFEPYTANNTQSYARFQTPKDIERYGAYKDDPIRAKATIRVTFRSSIAKGSRGAGNIVIIFDEMAHFTDNGQSSAEAVYEAAVPSTATFIRKNPKDKRMPLPGARMESKVIAISSPLGRQGKFFNLFQGGFESAKAADDRLCIQAATWEVNPSVSAQIFESSYLDDPRVFFTEFGADFTTRTREWIDSRDDLMACVDVNARPRMKAPPRLPHFMGIDVALVGDASAVAIGHLDENNKIVVDLVDTIKAGEGEFTNQARLEFNDVAMWIHDFTRRFYITEGMFDQWIGIPMEQALANLGLKQLQSVHHTPQLSSQMYQTFKALMYDRRLSLYNWPIPSHSENCAYIQELLDLQAEYKSKYVTIVEAPKVAGKHDDMADALVRMVWLASQHVSNPKVLAGANNRNLPAANPASSLQQRASMHAMMTARKKALQTGSTEERQVPRNLGFGRSTGGRGGGRNGGGRGGMGGWSRFGR